MKNSVKVTQLHVDIANLREVCDLIGQVRRVPRLVAAVLAAAIVVFVGPLSVAHAYNNYDPVCGKWSNPPGDFLRIGWRWGSSINPSGSWATAYQQASSSWSGTPTKVYMGYLSSSQATADISFDQGALEGGPSFTATTSLVPRYRTSTPTAIRTKTRKAVAMQYRSNARPPMSLGMASAFGTASTLRPSWMRTTLFTCPVRMTSTG